MIEAITKVVTIKEKEKTFYFLLQKLTPWQQTDLMAELVKIICKGSPNNSKDVEQALHLIMQSQHVVEEADKKKVNTEAIHLVIQAIKGALASLSKPDRDQIFRMLLSNLKIDISKEGKGSYMAASLENLDQYFDTYWGILSLLKEAFMFNLGFF